MKTTSGGIDDVSAYKIICFIFHLCLTYIDLCQVGKIFNLEMKVIEKLRCVFLEVVVVFFYPIQKYVERMSH